MYWGDPRADYGRECYLHRMGWNRLITVVVCSCFRANSDSATDWEIPRLHLGVSGHGRRNETSVERDDAGRGEEWVLAVQQTSGAVLWAAVAKYQQTTPTIHVGRVVTSVWSRCCDCFPSDSDTCDFWWHHRVCTIARKCHTQWAIVRVKAMHIFALGIPPQSF